MLKTRYEAIKGHLDLACRDVLEEYHAEISLDIELRCYGLPNEVSKKKLELLLNDIAVMLKWC